MDITDITKYFNFLLLYMTLIFFYFIIVSVYLGNGHVQRHFVRVRFNIITFITLLLTSRYLLVQSHQWKHQENVWNWFKVNKNTRTTSLTLYIVLVFPLLTWNKKIPAEYIYLEIYVIFAQDFAKSQMS